MKMTLNVFSALDQRPTTAIIQHSLKLSDTSVLPYKNGRASIKNVQKNLTNSSLCDKLRAINRRARVRTLPLSYQSKQGQCINLTSRPKSSRNY